MLLKTITMIAAIGVASAMLSVRANALPVAPAVQLTIPAVDNHVTLVRDGCGRGMRFSRSRGRCVESFDGGRRWDSRRRHRSDTERVIRHLFGSSQHDRRRHHRRHR